MARIKQYEQERAQNLADLKEKMETLLKEDLDTELR